FLQVSSVSQGKRTHTVEVLVLSLIRDLPRARSDARCRGEPSRSASVFGYDVAQTPPLPASGVEVRFVEPFEVRRSQGRPFGVDDREPRGVAVAALDHEVLPEHAFAGEAEPFGRPLRRPIVVIALPLEASEAAGEHEIGAEEERLGGRAGPRQRRTPEDVADLDDAVVRIDAHQRLPAFGPTGGPVDDGEQQRVRPSSWTPSCASMRIGADRPSARPGARSAAAQKRGTELTAATAMQASKPSRSVCGVCRRYRIRSSIPSGAETAAKSLSAF